jgi:predicted ATPase/DNA-binding SARP family transcriptional activator
MQRLRIVPQASPDRTLDAQLRISVLGSPRLSFGDDHPPFRGRPKLWPLLTLLALHHGDLLPREHVAALLWPDATDAAARGNLRRHLSYLEDALPALPGAGWLKRSSTHVGWNPERRLWIDARAFVEASLSDERLREAVELYGGDFLAGVDDEWVNTERERLRERYLYDLERLIEIERRAGDVPAALLHGAAALRVDPYREDVVRTVMRLRAESGDRAGALRDYERFATLLHDDLATEPAAATTRLATALIADEPIPADARALPLETTSFIGRSDEGRRLEALVAEHRIITIVGPPGIGKTRLALHTAHGVMSRFRDGARFVDLAAASGSDAVVHAMLDACDDPAQERTTDPTRLEDRLRRKALLLILDNAEHVAADVARIAARIARAAPGVVLVVTSRVVLDAPSEAVLRLEPLPPPEALRLFIDRARLARSDFRSDLLGTDAARTIARATDGLPLALELAAARLRTLALAEIVARLRRPLRFLGDEPDRRDPEARTLRASLAASYALLSRDERRLFRRLAVFAGGATVETARAICLDGADDWAALELLSRLVDHSLIVAPRIDAPEQRYELLQSIAEFARDRLDAEDDAPAVRRAHAIAFADRYIALNDELRGARAHHRFDAVAHDHDDLRRALDLLVDDAVDPVRGARLALALSRFWFDRGFIREGAQRLEAVLAAPLPPEVRAQVLHCLATLIRNQGNYERAFELFGQALALARETGDDIAIGKALATYSNAARMVGAYDEALTLATEAFITFARTGDAYLCGYALVTSGCAAFSQGDLSAARSAFDAALIQYRLTDAASDIALVLGNLALCAYYDGDLVAADILAAEAAGQAEALGNHYFRANALLTLVRIERRRCSYDVARGRLRDVFDLATTIDDKELLLATAEVAIQLALDVDPKRAATLLGALDAARDHYAVPRGPVERPEYGQLVGDLTTRLGPDVYAAARRAGARFSLADAVAQAAATTAAPAYGSR